MNMEKINERYDCDRDGHVLGRSYPLDSLHVRRRCVIPGCSFAVKRRAK